VRTAIDGRGQARVTEEGGALFAYQCQMAPQDAAGRPLTRWLFDLDLGTLPDDGERRRAWAELEELLAHGLASAGQKPMPGCRSAHWRTATQATAPSGPNGM
jgi:hypothetical protein